MAQQRGDLFTSKNKLHVSRNRQTGNLELDEICSADNKL